MFHLVSGGWNLFQFFPVCFSLFEVVALISASGPNPTRGTCRGESEYRFHFQLASVGFSSSSLVSVRFSCCQLISVGFNWIQSFLVTWLQLISACFSWFQLVSVGFSWFQSV